jgi:hypothetical protein
MGPGTLYGSLANDGRPNRISCACDVLGFRLNRRLTIDLCLPVDLAQGSGVLCSIFFAHLGQPVPGYDTPGLADADCTAAIVHLPRSRAGTLQSRSREKQSFFFRTTTDLNPS